MTLYILLGAVGPVQLFILLLLVIPIIYVFVKNIKWYLKCWVHYFDFRGRARRKEFWVFSLFDIFVPVLGIVGYGIISDGDIVTIGTTILIISVLYMIASFIPNLSVTCRRLHDSGKTAWWLLILLIPGVGAIVLFIFLLLNSKPENKWGPNPKLKDMNKKQCPYCGEELLTHVKKCKHCGEWLEDK